MKKILLVILILFSSVAVYAQNGNSKDRDGLTTNMISEFVNDLSPRQKKQLDQIYDDHKARIVALRKELGRVRDSLNVLIDAYGDHSAAIFPLIDREASLKCEINKEYYRVKVKIDKVLTKEQQQVYVKNRQRRKPVGCSK